MDHPIQTRIHLIMANNENKTDLISNIVVLTDHKEKLNNNLKKEPKNS